MPLVMQIRKPGDAAALEPAEITLPEPGPGEIRIRHSAIGVNFVDTYHRRGLYPLPALPAVLGVEAAGIVEAVGRDVDRLAVGMRVAYAGAPIGAYAAARILPAWRAVPLPDSVPDDVAAVALARGVTAEMLMGTVYPVGRGTTVLVHAAAGGLGSLLVAWAKRRGAAVIGTVSSTAKAEIARAAGADEVVTGRAADFVAAAKAWTDGRGVDVAYDGIGGTTLAKTFGAVRPLGTVASIGQAGGAIPPLAIETIGPRNLARPSVMLYMNDRENYRRGTEAVLASLRDGLLPRLGTRYALRDAARAHADMEAGRTTGAPLLIP
ncbi:quinone oxidoreductase family protein [Dongia sp. agr-C8]